MKTATTALLPLFISAAAATQLPLLSSYAAKCQFHPAFGHRYHDKEGPIGSSHKATFLCGGYPTDADFTPIPNVATADDCALACTGTCEGTTWSEVTGTEYQCHTWENFQGEFDRTEALIMTMTRPEPATAADQYQWICEDPQTVNGVLSKFQPPNLEIQYHCDSGPVWPGGMVAVSPPIGSLDECVKNCVDINNSGTLCHSAQWKVHPSAGCFRSHGPPGTPVARPGEMYIKIIEHAMP